MSKVEDFLTNAEEKEVVEAIRLAEKILLAKSVYT